MSYVCNRDALLALPANCLAGSRAEAKGSAEGCAADEDREKGSRVTLSHDNADCKNGHDWISETSQPCKFGAPYGRYCSRTVIRRQALKESAAGEWYLSWWSPFAIAALCA